MAAARTGSRCLTYLSRRYFVSNGASNEGRTALALTYERLGDPEDVVELKEISLPDKLSPDEIEVDILAAPVNPSDINQIQGTYPIKPSLPAVGGNEGVGVVRRLGSAVTGFGEGDWVIPMQPGLGTWRTSLISKADNFMRLPSSNVPVEFAATLQVNPPTAYRMLKDFVSLSPGDCVIQNGANSAVGQAVIQLAAAWGVHTVNVIRSRPESADFDVAGYLKELGGNEVVTEEFMASHEMKELMKNYNKPVLALNCVGGKSSTELLRHIKEKGTMITYGGMSRQPVTIPTSALIFKEVTCIGYWNGMWLIRNKERRHLIEEMFTELCTLAESEQLVAPRCIQYRLEDYKGALNNALKPFVSSKQLLIIKLL